MVDSTNPRVMADNIKMLAANGGATVEANPEGEATADLEKLEVDGTVYGIPSIEVNPEGEATADLEKLEVDGTIYEIPEASGMPNLSATETLTGRTYLGSPTYIKVFDFTGSQQVNSNLSWYSMPVTLPEGINNIVAATIKHFGGGITNAFDVQLSNGALQFRNHSMQNETFASPDKVILEYTKTES